ncbi:cell division protein FtsL [Pseudalkalibacillus sp. SCS-8]|uniref:cell division protein FtsL n=1 Tax=Pseudalkalibacillus nanhaiensis TaxID=3115291 RepID=UPI0032DABD3B
MSNLAHQVQRKTSIQEQQQTKPQVAKRTLARFTKGEKVLWSIAGIMFIAVSILVISNYAEIYTINKEIQVTEYQIEQQSEKVNDLALQKSELSEPLRIMNYAEEKLGMSINEKNVEIVNN